MTPEKAIAAEPQSIAEDAYKAAKTLNYYSSGIGATGKNLPDSYLAKAKQKYQYALQKLTITQEKAYQSKLKLCKAYITQGERSIAGVKAGQKVAAIRLKLESGIQAGSPDTSLVISLKNEVKAQTSIVQKISASQAKTRVYNSYIKPANDSLKGLSAALTVKLALN